MVSSIDQQSGFDSHAHISSYKRRAALTLQCCARQGPTMYRKAINSSQGGRTSRSLIFAYALAVMEENSDAGIIVTAPTCGSCGVVPATIGYLKVCARPAANGV
jgi:L-serine deaminase